MFKGILARSKLFLCLLLVTGLLAVFGGSPAMAQRGPEVSPQAKLPMGDIVFVMDESGSFFNDALAVDANLKEIVRLIEGVIDYQVGIVGFGAYEGHMGTKYAGQPYINLKLTPDMNAFSKALRTLVTQGSFEYGFDAVKLAMSDELGFRPGASVCVVMITDEDADIYPERPVTIEDAVAAMEIMNAFYLGVVDFKIGTTMSDYGPLAGSLAHATGGKVFDIHAFRKDPAPVLRELISSCVNRVKQEPTEDPNKDPTTKPEPVYVTIEEISSLKLVITRLVDDHALFLDRLSQITARLDALEALGAGIPDGIENRFAAIDVRFSEFERIFARYNVNFENIDASLNQVNSRLNGVEQGIASLRTTIASLQEANNAMAIRVAGLEGRIGQLEDADFEARLRELEKFISGFDVFHADLNALISWRDEASKRLAALEEQFGSLGNEFSAIHTALAGLVSNDNAFGSELQGLMGRLVALESQTGEIFGALSGRIEVLEQQLARFDALFQEVQAKLSAIDLSIFENQFQSFAAELEVLRETVAGHGQEITQLKDWMTSWDKDLKDLKASLSELTAQIADLGDMADQIDELQSAVDSLDSRLLNTEDILTARIRDNEAALEALKKELEAVNGQLKDLMKSLDENAYGFALDRDLESLNTSLGTRIQSLLRRIQNLEADIAKPDAETRAQLEEFSRLMAELQSKLADLAATQSAQYDELLARLMKGEENDARLDGWLKEIAVWLGVPETTEGVPTFDERIGNLEGRISELAAQLDKNQKSMSELQKSLGSLQSKLDELADKMGTESSAIDPARVRAAQRLAELAFLTAVAAIGISLLFFLSKS